MRRHLVTGVTQTAQCRVDGVFGHWIEARSDRWEDIAAIAGQAGSLAQDGNGLDGQRNSMFHAGLHPLGRDAPDGRVESADQPFGTFVQKPMLHGRPPLPEIRPGRGLFDPQVLT